MSRLRSKVSIETSYWITDWFTTGSAGEKNTAVWAAEGQGHVDCRYTQPEQLYGHHTWQNTLPPELGDSLEN